MASEQICEILNIMSEDYDQGVYPGRNSEGLNPDLSGRAIRSTC